MEAIDDTAHEYASAPIAPPPRSPSPSASPRLGYCGYMTHWLGLTAEDERDGVRCYIRAASLLFACCCFIYLLLLISFASWMDYPVFTATLAITVCTCAMTAALGIGLTRRKKAGTMPLAVLNEDEDADQLALDEAADSDSRHGVWWYASLFCLKYMALLPMSLLNFFMSIFLAVCMAGWTDVETGLSSANRRQIFAVLLLTFNSLITLLLQCALYFFTTQYEKQMSRDNGDAESDPPLHRRE